MNTILEEVRVYTNLLQFRPKKKEQWHRLHTLNTLHTPSRISTEYIVHDRFSTEMTKNTNGHRKTLPRPTLRRREPPQCCTNFNSPHARRTLTQRPSNSRMTRKFLLVAGCASVDPYWITNQEGLTFMHMFTVRKTWVMEVDVLSCARARETPMKILSDPGDNFPCARATEQDDESFSVITWTFERESFSTALQMDRVQRNCKWNPVPIRTKKCCSRVQLCSWKTFENLYSIWNLVGNDDIKENICGCSQRDTQASAWWRTHNYHWHAWTHYARCLDTRDVSIWASNWVHCLKFKRL